MKEKILAILSDLHPEFDYTTSSNFIEEGLIDSFDIVSLVSELNVQFGIEISGDDVLPENFENVQALEKLVAKYTK